MDDTFFFDGKKTSRVFYFKKDPNLLLNIIDSVDIDTIAYTLKAFLQQYNNRMLDNDLDVRK